MYTGLFGKQRPLDMSVEYADARRSRRGVGKRKVTVRGKTIETDKRPSVIAREILTERMGRKAGR